jgi:hypothetical protein
MTRVEVTRALASGEEFEGSSQAYLLVKRSKE